MMNKIRGAVLVFGIAIGIGLMVPVANVGAASSVIEEQCKDNPDSAVCKTQYASADNLTQNIVNTLLFVVGAISVVMIIVGGIMYATSAGDAGRVTKAKNTIMYSLVGLVISFLAFAIVQFVVRQVAP
jgi:hypothetical protein